VKEYLRWSGFRSLGLVVAFGIGDGAVQCLPAFPPLWLSVSLAVALVAALFFRRLVIAATLAGLVWALGFGAIRLQNALPTDAGRMEALVQGRILTIPVRQGRGLRFDFAPEVLPESDGVPVPDHIRLSWYDTDRVVRAGELWRFRVKLRRPHGMMNPGSFDYEQWLFAEGIRALGYVRDSPDTKKLENASLMSVQGWRQTVYDRLDAALKDSPVAGLIKALTLGADDDITPAQWQVLRRTGTAHLIAISGSHIGLIAGLVFVVTRRLSAELGLMRWSPPKLAAHIAFIAALVYSALADFAIPTQRALIMTAVAMAAVSWQRRLNLPHVLAVTALLVMLYDPFAVLAAGFWLSFGAVALIVYALTGRYRPSRGWRALLTINMVTALGLAPLLLLFFRQVPVVSPLANLLAVPLLGTLLLPICLGGTLLLPLLPAVGLSLLHLAEWILQTVWPALNWLSELTWAQWSRPPAPLWALCLSLPGLLLLLAPRGIPARWLGLVMLLPALLITPEHLAPGTYRLNVLDVGQGLSAVIETRHHSLVFDTGARLSEAFDMGRAVVGPYLQERGIDRIDALIVSHGDNDHSGGAASLLTSFEVPMLYSSVSSLIPQHAVIPCVEGQHWEWDGVDFAMLGPPASGGLTGNDASCVMRVSGVGGSSLLTGDIERAGESALVVHHGDELASDVLVVPHHGSKTSSTAELLARVRPRFALIPAGHLNGFGFPHPPVLARYRHVGAEIMTTGEAGAISMNFATRPGDLRPQSYRQAHRRYWSGR
jgi:competence protein ComEC